MSPGAVDWGLARRWVLAPFSAICITQRAPPTILLREGWREGWREGGKVKKRTLANLSKWPPEKIESLRRLLKNEPLVRREEAFDVERSLPVHSFPTLLADLAAIAKNRVIPRLSGAEPFTVVTRPAALLTGL